MFIRLGDILPVAAKRNRIYGRVQAVSALAEFKNQVKKILGEKYAKKIKPLYIKNGVLFVSTLSFAVSQELKNYEKNIVSGINGACDKKINKIAFVL